MEIVVGIVATAARIRHLNLAGAAAAWRLGSVAARCALAAVASVGVCAAGVVAGNGVGLIAGTL
jgi:hypothetical protein